MHCMGTLGCVGLVNRVYSFASGTSAGAHRISVHAYAISGGCARRPQAPMTGLMDVEGNAACSTTLRIGGTTHLQNNRSTPIKYASSPLLRLENNLIHGSEPRRVSTVPAC